ncbi:M14 family metallopeptidase [Flavobacterium sp. ASW18X]|uniref:M14 family metallopeptidase n=1 Tax=Flavobacterium sp. ASW18X TaxID=2572595 RepID=UPI0010AE90A1|nr:M14 family metallopeptidase [Flavobacterium sp. ASW18X]TKD66235.1 hypothetical protein FBT53_05000 [Flavobacterium sp. ASW18X]
MKTKLYFLFLIIIVVACKNATPLVEKPSGYQGQGKSPVVPTASKPVQKQYKYTWSLNDSTVFFSNQFDGARLNGLVHDGNDHYTIWITAENTPINVSPWYAFKVWSTTKKEVIIKLTYQDIRSRYYPKISTDGILFKAIDSVNYTEINPGEGDFGIKAAPEAIEIKVTVTPEPTWISAQELYTSTHVKQWIDSLTTNSFTKTYSIGKTTENRDLHLLELNQNNSKKAILIISRQHPPEVTGFLAMKSFMETLAGESELAKTFRTKFTVFNVPLMNPDGVDNGHWRHNMGGIDLNRDWQNFNQPETRAVRDFLKRKEKEGHRFVFGADFHSTWDDIYYPLDATITGPENNIVFNWIENISERLPQKRTNVKPSKDLEPTMVSRTYFYVAHHMPAIVFELGDNTPRPFLKQKGIVAAEELMQLLLKEYP